MSREIEDDDEEEEGYGEFESSVSGIIRNSEQRSMNSKSKQSKRSNSKKKGKKKKSKTSNIQNFLIAGQANTHTIS